MKFKKIIVNAFESEFKVIVLLFLFYIIGFIFSCYYCFSNQISATVFTNVFISNSFNTVLFKNLVLLLAVFLAGYTAFGIPVILLSLVYLGMANAALFSYFISNHLIKGLLLSFVFNFAYIFIVLISLLFVSFSSLRLTLITFNSFRFNNKYISPASYSPPHILKFTVFFILIFISTIIYSYLLLPILNYIL